MQPPRQTLDRNHGDPRLPLWPSPGGPPAWVWLALSGAALTLVGWREVRTSELQSRLFPAIARGLSFAVAPGPSSRIVWPGEGPLDVRHGYARIPDFARRLALHGYRLVEQTRFSRGLASLAGLGIPPPYREASAPGLVIRGAAGDTLYDLTPRHRQFADYEDIPPVIVQAITTMEDRDLALGEEPRLNPAVDWGRFCKATLLYAGSKLGLPIRVEGGSTLAIQMEKYRHSGEGRTESGYQKLQQMFAASLRAYREGPDTRGARREIVLDYLNTMPLAAAPGVGEVHGLKDGLRVWFGLDPEEALDALSARGADPARAIALKHVLALLCAVRAPSRYLLEEHKALEERADRYAALLAREGVLERDLAEAMLATPLAFFGPRDSGTHRSPSERKPLNMIRGELLTQLGVRDFYDLDQLHLDVETTLDSRLQQRVSRLFENLRDPAFVAANGLVGERLLGDADPGKVVYSLMLFESTPAGNLLRVHTDNLDGAFDVNRSTRIELGSTAKLRTLAHYLEIVAELHGQLAPLPHRDLVARARRGRDPLTTWAATALAGKPDLGLDSLLQRALERRYSASPWETFFTGGGIHTFGNFDPEDDRRIYSVREATAHSTNLVFIRLMRDVVRYHVARLPYDARAVLEQTGLPQRRQMLQEIADDEARDALQRAWRRYRGLSRDEAILRFLGDPAATPRELAMVFYGWRPGGSLAELDGWLRGWGLPMSTDSLADLATDFGSMRRADVAYRLDRNLLDLWALGEMVHDPHATWNDLLERSRGPRAEASAWLLETHHRRPQDIRLRIRIERDAFARMTPYWRRLGFPFTRLVPSYATAIGSASDRPVALARLMGIIVNEGVDRSAQSVRQLRFAPETPYYTALAPAPDGGEHVLAAPIARALRDVLRGVVDHGTARRVNGAFRVGGDILAVGGKTGSGDNRFETFGPGGNVLTSRAVSRTAAFVFYIGDRHFGVITCAVNGPQAEQYHFTSSLPLAVLRLLAPSIDEHIAASRGAPELPPAPIEAPAPPPEALAATAPPETPEGEAPTGDAATHEAEPPAAEAGPAEETRPARADRGTRDEQPFTPDARSSRAAMGPEEGVTPPNGREATGPTPPDPPTQEPILREPDPAEIREPRGGERRQHLFDRLARPSHESHDPEAARLEAAKKPRPRLP